MIYKETKYINEQKLASDIFEAALSVSDTLIFINSSMFFVAPALINGANTMIAVSSQIKSSQIDLITNINFKTPSVTIGPIHLIYFI